MQWVKLLKKLLDSSSDGFSTVLYMMVLLDGLQMTAMISHWLLGDDTHGAFKPFGFCGRYPLKCYPISNNNFCDRWGVSVKEVTREEAECRSIPACPAASSTPCQRQCAHEGPPLACTCLVPLPLAGAPGESEAGCVPGTCVHMGSVMCANVLTDGFSQTCGIRVYTRRVINRSSCKGGGGVVWFSNTVVVLS